MTLNNSLRWENAGILSTLELSHISAPASLISFARRTLLPEVTDMKGIRDAMRRVASTSSSDIFHQAVPAGYRPLRKLLSERMLSQRVPASVDSIVLTGGLQSTLMDVGAVLLTPGDRVVVEVPSSPSTFDTLRRMGAHLVPVPVDRDGVLLDKLELALAKHRPTLFLTTPNFSNPTGYVTSLARRREILDLAVAYDCFVLENDEYSDLHFEEFPPPPLISIANDIERKKVIYASSLESSFPQTLRLGWFVADSSVVGRFNKQSRAGDFGCHISQLIAYEYLNMGRIEAALGKIRNYYRGKANTFLRTIKSEFPTFKILTDPLQGGLFVWGVLQNWDTSQLLHRPVLENVVFAPGALFYPNPTISEHIRFSYAGSKDCSIRSGLRRISLCVSAPNSTFQPNY